MVVVAVFIVDCIQCIDSVLLVFLFDQKWKRWMQLKSFLNTQNKICIISKSISYCGRFVTLTDCISFILGLQFIISSYPIQQVAHVAYQMQICPIRELSNGHVQMLGLKQYTVELNLERKASPTWNCKAQR